MDSSVSLKDEMWFLRVCHHISNAVYSVPSHFKRSLQCAITFQLASTSTLAVAEGRLRLKCDGTRWCTGGEVKGKLANAVRSQYSSHYLGTWCIQHYYRWCAQLGCQQSTELTPRRFKWTSPFRWKSKSGFCACAITFQTQSSVPSHFKRSLIPGFCHCTTIIFNTKSYSLSELINIFCQVFISSKSIWIKICSKFNCSNLIPCRPCTIFVTSFSPLALSFVQRRA